MSRSAAAAFGRWSWMFIVESISFAHLRLPSHAHARMTELHILESIGGGRCRSAGMSRCDAAWSLLLSRRSCVSKKSCVASFELP